MKIVKNIKELIDAIGLKPGEIIEITGSQHQRDYKIEIDFIPGNKIEFEIIIATASEENLKKMGVSLWTTYDYQQKEKKGDRYLKPGEKHFLFPFEWYDSIPNGFEIIDIFGEKEKFQHGKTDNDMRFGCLCFGFIR